MHAELQRRRARGTLPRDTEVHVRVQPDPWVAHDRLEAEFLVRGSRVRSQGAVPLYPEPSGHGGQEHGGRYVQAVQHLLDDLERYLASRERVQEPYDASRDWALGLMQQQRMALLQREAQRHEAQQRAEALLREWLPPFQRAQYDESGWFSLWGSNGDVFVVHKRMTFNVHRFAAHPQGLDKSLPFIAVYCATPADPLPLGDQMLAQALHLMTDARGFLAVANCAGVRWANEHRLFAHQVPPVH